ncbi:hypothetical protein [Brachybacterium avium]|uniref:hypothetical protein n=1 Tax=Brachybacterium avium TaxID=2017485 RepID=UPI0012FE5738|nr:hypothetical protein [Brachybacterium avium]
MSTAGLRPSRPQGMFAQERQFGRKEDHLLGGALELLIEFVPLAFGCPDVQVVPDSGPKLFRRRRGPDRRCRVDDGPTVSEHVSDDLAAFGRDFEFWGRPGRSGGRLCALVDIVIGHAHSLPDRYPQ